VDTEEDPNLQSKRMRISYIIANFSIVHYFDFIIVMNNNHLHTYFLLAHLQVIST